MSKAFWQGHSIKPQQTPPAKKPGEIAREGVVRGDQAGMDTQAIEANESVPDFTKRVAATRQVHRNALERQQNLRKKGSAY